jgi:hypothetical protein
VSLYGIIICQFITNTRWRTPLTKLDDIVAWQARKKIGNRWVPTTTKQNEMARTTKIAQDIYLDVFDQGIKYLCFNLG